MAEEFDISSIDTSSAEFQNALTMMRDTRRSLFLTGKAGTGKSTFLRYFMATTKKKCVVLAPTGIAAVNVGGQTIHSFFKMPFKPMLPQDPEVSTTKRLKARMKYAKPMVKLLQRLDVIIIDEISMVRADTIDFIDRLLRVYVNGREPFGGKQLLLLGDVFQLEPVITGEVRDILAHEYPDGFYFFNANVFRHFPLISIELQKVYRQSDTAFVEMLNRIRCGRPLRDDIELLNSRIVAEDHQEDMVMTIATRRDTVDSINESRLAQINRPTRKFIGRVRGDFPETSMPTDKELVLKEGAQVVFVKNDMERRWVNGTLGRVVSFGEGTIMVETSDGEKHSVEPEVWSNVRYQYKEDKHEIEEKEIGSFVQFPLKLAWAITIHKSQGLTFDKVIIDVGQGAFSSGQSYVALSRCRSLEGIRMRSTINARDIFVNPRIIDFSHHFNDPQAMAAVLRQSRATTCYRQGVEAFNRGDYRMASALLAEAVGLDPLTASSPLAARFAASKLHAIDSMRAENLELRQKLAEQQRLLARLATEYVELGEQCRQEGWDVQAAINNYDKALQLSPDYSLAWLGKGMAYAQSGDPDEALRALDRAAALDDSDYRPLLEAGRLLVASGDVAAGMDYLLRALDRNEDIAEIHLALADGYELAEDAEAAEKHRRAAARLRRKAGKK